MSTYNHTSLNLRSARLAALIVPLIFLILTLLFFASSLARALPDDRQQPIKIDADRAIRNDKTGVTEFVGNATLTQGSMVIKANNITISEKTKGISEIFAFGAPATFSQQPKTDQPPVTAEANRIEYDISLEIIRLLDNAKIDKNGSVITSNSIQYDINESTAESTGGVGIVIQPQ